MNATGGRAGDGARRGAPDRRLAEATADGRDVVFETDCEGRWTFLNAAWERLVGIPVDTALGTECHLLIHPDDRPASLARLVALLNGEKEDCRAIFRMVHADGSLRWTEIVARQRRDADGALVGLTGRLADVTDRVGLEQELERQRRMLATVIEGSRVGIWERDERTDAAWYSAEWATMLGYQPDEIENVHAAFMRLVHPDDLEYHRIEAAKIVSREADVFEVQLRMRHKLGHWVWIRSRGRVMEWAPDGSALVTAGTHTEINDQVVAEQAVRTAQKMEALGRIAGGVAHDFNNLLGVILGSVDLIDPSTAGMPVAPAATQHALQVIRSATERATSLTKRLLDIAQERTGPVVVVDLERAADDAVPLIAKALPDSVTLVRRSAGVPLPIEADVGLLTDTLLNLAINARDAMPDGGTLTIRTERRAGATPSDARAAIVVSDTGVGMTTEVQQRIFEPFFSTKPQGEGTGLGLALAYAFVRQSAGTISVVSHPGEGSSFVLEFACSARPLSDHGAGRAAEPPQGGGETVLVVDDEGLLRELARSQLEAAGYRVLLATDGLAALEMLDSLPEIELVFSDVVMPGGVSGVDLASTIRTRYPDVRVVLTTGFANTQRSPYDGHLLHKPYSRADLLNTLRTALDN